MGSSKQLIPATLIFLCFSLFLFPEFVEAGNKSWKAVTGKNGEGRVLYDPDSVIPLGPGSFRVWIISFDNDNTPRKALEEIDCSNRIYRDIEVIMENPDKPSQHTFTSSEWRGIDRGSPRGELTRMLCR